MILDKCLRRRRKKKKEEEEDLEFAPIERGALRVAPVNMGVLLSNSLRQVFLTLQFTIKVLIRVHPYATITQQRVEIQLF